MILKGGSNVADGRVAQVYLALKFLESTPATLQAYYDACVAQAPCTAILPPACMSSRLVDETGMPEDSARRVTLSAITSTGGGLVVDRPF